MPDSKDHRMAHKQFVNQERLHHIRLVGTRTALFDRLHSLLGRTNGFSFKGSDALALQKPCVYLWLRNNEVLYVGMSKGGAERPFSPRHKTLKIEPDDEVWVWPVQSIEEAEETEKALISAFSPALNKRRTYARHLLKDRLGVSYSRASVLRPRTAYTDPLEE